MDIGLEKATFLIPVSGLDLVWISLGVPFVKMLICASIIEYGSVKYFSIVYIAR